MIQSQRLSPPLWTRWLVVGLWMAFIFIMSAQSNSGEQSGLIARLVAQVIGAGTDPSQFAWVHHLIRKLAHFTEYGILAVLMAWAQPGLNWKRAALTWVAASLYAASDEWHQSFVPNRGPAVTDVLIDASGALAGLAVWMLWARRR
ncbi:VanZ like family protein [compost metagenome]